MDVLDAGLGGLPGRVLGAYEEAAGRFDSFAFVPGEIPLSTGRAAAIAVAAYLCTIATLKRARKDAKPRKLTTVFVVHNLALSVLSGVLLAALLFELTKEAVRVGGGLPGLWRVWCDPLPSHFVTGRLVALYYVNYLFKYYELLDTCLMVMRGKPTPFLHVYHHAATLVLCWSQLHEHSGCQWVPIGLNLFVHVIMYYYYAMSSLGYRFWWKKYLTSLQIVQFAVDVPSCVAMVFAKHAFHNGWDISWAKPIFGDMSTDCGGTFTGGYFGIFILFSYLVLFINFYIVSYLSGGTTAGAAKAKKDK